MRYASNKADWKNKVLNYVFRRKQSAQGGEFEFIMCFAKDLAKCNPTALIDLTRILLRPLQSELLLSVIENKSHCARSSIDPYKFFMPDGPSEIQIPFGCPRLDSEKFLVHLSCDPILPCPWHREHYANSLAGIGRRKKCGSWEEDAANHNVTLWLPWGIAFVHGGNHSIASGIVGGEGVLRPKDVYDMGRLLDLVQCDGKYYQSRRDHKMLDVVRDYKIAALFEMGRLMQKHRIMPMAI